MTNNEFIIVLDKLPEYNRPKIVILMLIIKSLIRIATLLFYSSIMNKFEIKLPFG